MVYYMDGGCCGQGSRHDSYEATVQDFVSGSLHGRYGSLLEAIKDVDSALIAREILSSSGQLRVVYLDLQKRSFRRRKLKDKDLIAAIEHLRLELVESVEIATPIPKRGRGRPPTDEKTMNPAGRRKAANQVTRIELPGSLMDRIRDERTARGMSTSELLAAALDALAEREARMDRAA